MTFIVTSQTSGLYLAIVFGTCSIVSDIVIPVFFKSLSVFIVRANTTLWTLSVLLSSTICLGQVIIRWNDKTNDQVYCGGGPPFTIKAVMNSLASKVCNNCILISFDFHCAYQYYSIIENISQLTYLGVGLRPLAC